MSLGSAADRVMPFIVEAYASQRFEAILSAHHRGGPGDGPDKSGIPDCVMYTLSSFERRLIHGENIGSTETHVLFVESKDPPARPSDDSTQLGPSRVLAMARGACRAL